MLLQREKKPHFIFASPNIPNPRVYLRMMTEAETGDENALAITYSPVMQIKFIMDLQHGKIEVYNEHKNDKILLAHANRVSMGLNDFLLAFESQNQKLPK